jgi:hypothetical protein
MPRCAPDLRAHVVITRLASMAAGRRPVGIFIVVVSNGGCANESSGTAGVEMGRVDAEKILRLIERLVRRLRWNVKRASAVKAGGGWRQAQNAEESEPD